MQAIAALRWAPGTPLASRAVVVAAVALIQVGLGIATLLALVPIELALPRSGDGARAVWPCDRACARDRDGAGRVAIPVQAKPG